MNLTAKEIFPGLDSQVPDSSHSICNFNGDIIQQIRPISVLNLYISLTIL
jgi:hypothetical protein